VSVAYRANCPCGAEYDLAEPSLGSSFVCAYCDSMYAVVEADAVPQPDALPLANCKCGATVDLNGVAVGERVQCACARGMWAVRAARTGASPAPPDSSPETWNDVLWACSSSREVLVAMTIVQGLGAVVGLTSVPAIVLLMLGLQLLLWLAFVNCQTAARRTPDRGARRAVASSLAFSFGALGVGTGVGFFVAPVYGVGTAVVLGAIGYMYWIAYFNWLGIALRAHELSARAARYTSAFVVGVVLLMVSAVLLGDNSTPPVRDPVAPARAAQRPHRAANLPFQVAHLALSVWLLVGYVKLTGEAERVIRERASVGALPE
jgi:hypothetical protein